MGDAGWNTIRRISMAVLPDVLDCIGLNSFGGNRFMDVMGVSWPRPSNLNGNWKRYQDSGFVCIYLPGLAAGLR